MDRLLLKRGRVIDPASGNGETAEVLIEGGGIKAIGRIPHPGTARARRVSR